MEGNVGPQCGAIHHPACWIEQLVDALTDEVSRIAGFTTHHAPARGSLRRAQNNGPNGRSRAMAAQDRVSPNSARIAGDHLDDLRRPYRLVCKATAVGFCHMYPSGGIPLPYFLAQV